MPINENEITEEMIMRAMQCKTVEELMALAKAESVEITKEEAEAYIEELAEFELGNGNLKKIAGGVYRCPDLERCKYEGYWKTC